MTKEAELKRRLAEAADTIEGLLKLASEKDARIAAFEKEARARRLAQTMVTRGVAGDEVLSEDSIQKLASSPDLDKYEAVMPMLASQKPLWERAEGPSAAVRSPADDFNTWVSTGQMPVT